jgi:hypothetical protein
MMFASNGKAIVVEADAVGLSMSGRVKKLGFLIMQLETP